MDNRELTTHVIEVEKKIEGLQNKYDEKIKTIFFRQDKLDDLTEIMHKTIGEIKVMSQSMKDMDTRLACMENEKRQKHFELWKILVPGVVGALIMYAVNYMLR